MTDAKELEQRITAALERIAGAVDQIPSDAPADQSDQIASLTESLEAERNANAQLEERVLALREKQDKVVARLEDELTRARQDFEAISLEAARMGQLNENLRTNNAALRDANAQGLGDASAINAAMATELENLRAMRDHERAALDAVIADLKPVVEGHANA